MYLYYMYTATTLLTDTVYLTHLCIRHMAPNTHFIRPDKIHDKNKTLPCQKNKKQQRKKKGFDGTNVCTLISNGVYN